MGLLLFAGNSFGWAVTQAQTAAFAGFGINDETHQRFAHTGATLLLVDVRLVLVAEVSQGGKDRVRRGSAQLT